MTRLRDRNLERGQFTVGLALGFTFVLVIFSLIFHSGIITREKMKLQASTDLSALQASAFQRDALNEIRNINEAIERKYLATQSALLPPLPPCLGFPGYPNALSIIPSLSAFSSVSTVDLDGKPEEMSYDPCEKACNGFESFVRNQWIDDYRRQQKRMSFGILDLIENANKQSFELAENTFFIFGNLPLGTQQRLRKRYSGKPTSAQILSDYRGGRLEELNFTHANRDTPLFAPYQELRQLAYFKYRYKTIPSTLASPPLCQYLGPRPRTTIVPVKITRDSGSSYVTSFLSLVQYMPKHLSRFILKLKWWGPTKEAKKPVFAKGASGGDISIVQDRKMMGALSLAKPYGGTFPKAGALVNPADFGSVGDKFEGARLVGIADKGAQGGELFPFQFEVPVGDVSGREVGTFKANAKDFLH